MTLQYEFVDNGQSKLVIFFGWQGSTPRYRAKYLQLWSELGFNCLGLGLRFDLMLSPPAFLRNRALELCRVLKAKNLDKQPIILHSCSNGGMHNTMAFVDVIQSNKEFQYINDNISGIVLDSAPARQNWETFSTLTKVNFGPVLSLFFQMLLAIFYLVGKVSLPIIGKNALSHFPEWIHGRITKCLTSYKHLPMLFLYSKTDPLARYDYVDEVILTLQERGAKNIRSKLWDDTEHVGHYRQKPEEYKNEIMAFLTHSSRL